MFCVSPFFYHLNRLFQVFYSEVFEKKFSSLDRLRPRWQIVLAPENLYKVFLDTILTKTETKIRENFEWDKK